MKVSSFVSLHVTFNFISLYVTMTLGRSIQSEETSKNSEFDDNKQLGVSTYHIGKTDKEKIHKMATIVDALEKLGVLDPSQKNCYTVEKIVKSLHTEGDATYRVGIYLYIKEANNNNNKDSSTSPQCDSLSKQSSNNSSSELSSNSSLLSSSSDSDEGNCENLTGTPINSDGGSVKTGTGKISSSNSRTGDDASKTKHPDKHKPKLSRTQIMVIATCSTVIGLFFIVAVIMRVRNYIKRNRDSDMDERPTFRSCSVALRGAGGMGGSQRSNSHYSTATKSNDAGPVYRKVDEKEAEEDELSPKSSNENRPLLIVTSASAPPSPIPVRKDLEKKSVTKNEYVKFIPKAKQSNYTNAISMEDEDDMTPVPIETPDDEISNKTPGSQETLLEDASDDDVLLPIGEQEAEMPDLFANCPQLAYEHMQRENSQDNDPPTVVQNNSDIPTWETTLHSGVGFSQSDNSLNDRNQTAYCYGNQVEYSNAADPAHETSCRACSAPPTPEVVRRILHYSLSSECDVCMYLDEDNVDNVDSVTPVSPSSQSPPVYTQAPSTSCQVTNSTNQPKIVVQPPLASCHMIYHDNPTSGMSEERDNNDCFQEHPELVTFPTAVEDNNDCFQEHPELVTFPTAVEDNYVTDDVNDVYDDCFSDNLPANSDNDTLITDPNSINDNQTPLSPEDGAPDSQPPSTGGVLEDPEVDSEASDSEDDDDSIIANMSYGERSFLLDPAFEGMEPTYV